MDDFLYINKTHQSEISNQLSNSEKNKIFNNENNSFESVEMPEKFAPMLSVSIKTEEIIALENELFNLLIQQDNGKNQKGLPSKYIKKIKKMKIGFASKQCSVCVSNFLNGEIIRKLPCSHIYHEDCLRPWLKKHTNCPMCRLDLMEFFEKEI